MFAVALGMTAILAFSLGLAAAASPSGVETGRADAEPPEISVSKGDTGGAAQAGGVYVYHVQYQNQGTGPAENVRVSDTLPSNTSYAGDTSGLSHTVSAGTVIWDVGTLQPGRHDFMVTLNVSSSVPPGTLAPNCITINTTTPGDPQPDNNSSCSGPVKLKTGNIDFNVETWGEPGDPAPGQEYDAVVSWCANHGVAAGPVALTDTLPVSTTVLSGRSENDQEIFWNLVSATGGQVVLSAPGLPGNRCERLRLRLRVDPQAPPGLALQNRVVLGVAGDVNPDNNQSTDTDTQVGAPRYSLYVLKDARAGQFSPGGWINYNLGYRNEGNSATPARLVETLPPGTTYRAGSARRWPGGTAFPPAVVSADTLEWDLGTLGVAEGWGIDFILDVSPTVAPGVVLNNCATILRTDVEPNPAENTACAAVTINPAGPNLRVVKSYQWEKDGQLSYEIDFYNIGDQPANDVWITDTLPTGTTWGGKWGMDFDGERLIDQQLSDHVLKWKLSTLYPGDSGSFNFNANVDNPDLRPAWYTNTAEITVPAGDVNPADNTATALAVKGEVERVELWVDRPAGNVWGQALPGAPITVTTTAGEYAGRADGGGNWNIDSVAELHPGDALTVRAGEGKLPVEIIVPQPFTALADSQQKKVWGQVDSVAGETVNLSGYWSGGGRDVLTDATGHYTATFAEMPRGAQGDMRYETGIDYARVDFHRVFRSPDLVFNVYPGQDVIEGQYSPGHTLWITVTNSGGETKATARLTTAVLPFWGGQPGFRTQPQDWAPRQPDITPGDWVYGSLDNGQSTTVRVGTITGNVDAEHDVVTGTISAPWFIQPLRVSCEIWMPNSPSPIDTTVAPDGGSYRCDFTTVGWDLQPGQPIGVTYLEPDEDTVRERFIAPSPHLRLNTWADASPGEGGNFTLHVEYHNDGDAPAENSVVTATLDGLSYLADTSGVPHTGGGSGPVAWNLGTLQPSAQAQFDVFVRVTAPHSNTVTSLARIATSNPFDVGDPGEKESQPSWHVEANDTQLNVGKSVWTWDPAPGYDYVYSINVCNNGSTGSAEITLTDDLPAGTTLVGWWAQHAGWNEGSRSPSRLVLSRPSLAGWSCSAVYVRVHLDAAVQPGAELVNRVQISAANDLTPDDNQAEVRHNAGQPHTNLCIQKRLGWGGLFSGGELRYWLHYANTGNVPVVGPIFITDTLPADTVFTGAWRYDDLGEHPVPPVATGPGYVVWQIDGLDNGASGDLDVGVRVDQSLTPGTALVNTAAISRRPVEDDYADNVSEVTQILNPIGPNLRVQKQGGWNSFGEGHNAWYRLKVENIGDTPIANVVFTDTYPAGWSLDGGVNVSVQRRWDWRDNPAGGFFTVTIEALNPGEWADVNFNARIPGDGLLPFGEIYTNTVRVMHAPGDVNVADDVASYALGTGPDLYVDKTLTGGVPLPGELVTFTLRVGNAQPDYAWWWNMQGSAMLVDELPAGLQFVSAKRHFCASSQWCNAPPIIAGNQLIWGLGRFNAGDWNEIMLTVRVASGVTGQDILRNRAVVSSDQPQIDVDPFSANNSAVYDLVVPLLAFAVSKSYAGGRVAGTVITYTLAVTNSGHSAGTAIRLADPLPAGLTYGGGGDSFTAGVVGWTIPSLASGASTTRWFTATLGCNANATVTNADYRVTGSDQGVSSAAGAPVALTTIAPTIHANFAAAPLVIRPGQTVAFTATATTDGVPIATYAWDFGDTNAGAGIIAAHAYTRPGRYTVTLTVTDRCGFSTTKAITDLITVQPLRVYLPLTLKTSRP